MRAAVAKSFTREWWEQRSGRCYPSRVPGRGSADADRLVGSWELAAVGVRKCRLHAANARCLREEARAFVALFEEEGTPARDEARPKIKLARSAAESKHTRSHYHLVASASSSSLNYALSALLPSLRSLEHLCHVTSRHLVRAALPYDDNEALALFAVPRAFPSPAYSQAAAPPSGATVSARLGAGKAARPGSARVYQHTYTRVYRPFEPQRSAAGDALGRLSLAPLSSLVPCATVLSAALRLRAAQLRDQVTTKERQRQSARAASKLVRVCACARECVCVSLSL